MKKVVIALGGNALGKTPKEQLELAKRTASLLVEIIKDGYECVITHGNGPQVGIINMAMEMGASQSEDVPSMPFAECGAMSQGYIGYHLQQAFEDVFHDNDLDKAVVTVVTQVLVHKNDPAFQNPTKPIGLFYTKEEAETIHAEKGYQFVLDAGRGYRRVVPSPTPVGIVELDTVKMLLNQGVVVITVGGGGIPVIRSKGDYKGIDAVIDKDRSSSKLGNDLDCDVLLILTTVEKVAIHYQKPNEKLLDKMTVKQAKKYMEKGEFAPGSMLPKVQACCEFVEAKPGRMAIITSLEQAKDALDLKTGTRIVE